MSQTNSKLGIFAKLPAECRSMIYESLLPGQLFLDIVAPLPSTSAPLVSPLESLAETNHSLRDDIKSWYHFKNEVMPALTRNTSLGFGIHDSSKIACYVNCSQIPTNNISDQTWAFKQLFKQVSALTSVKGLSTMTKFTILPTINEPSPGSPNVGHLEFMLLLHILETFPSITNVSIQFPQLPSSETPSTSSSPSIAPVLGQPVGLVLPPLPSHDSDPTLTKTLQFWIMASLFRIDSENDESDIWVAGLKHIDIFVHSQHSIDKSVLPFWWAPIENAIKINRKASLLKHIRKLMLDGTHREYVECFLSDLHQASLGTALNEPQVPVEE